MIVETLETVQKILPSYNLKSDSSLEQRMSEFLARAQEWVTQAIIGNTMIDRLESGLELDAAMKKVQSMAARVICELAYLTAIAELDLQLSEAGFVVQNNEKMSPASQQRVDRLKLSLEERLNDDCDALVETLMDNGHRQVFDDWLASPQYSYLTQAFLPTMREAARYSSPVPARTWREFHDLQPRLSDALSVAADYVSMDQIETLLELYRDNELLEDHRKALRWIRMSVLAEAKGERDTARHHAIGARNHMLRHEASFPRFTASDKYSRPEPFNAGDGTVANFL